MGQVGESKMKYCSCDKCEPKCSCRVSTHREICTLCETGTHMQTPTHLGIYYGDKKITSGDLLL